MRSWWSFVSVGALWIGVVGCAHDPSDPSDTTPAGGVGGGAGGPVGGGAGGGTGGMPPMGPVEDPYEAPVPPPPLPDEVLAQLAGEIDAVLDSVGGATHSVLITQAESGSVVYQRDPDQLLKPASNTKLFTTASALAQLGADHRARVTAYATGPVSGGVLAGDLLVIAEHDFSASTRFYADGRFPYDELADEVSAAGVSAIDGNVIAAGELIYGGQSLGTYNPETYRGLAASALRDAMVGAGIAVSGGASSAGPDVFDPPGGATELASYGAIPMQIGASPINVSSHNEFADILLNHIGYQLGTAATYSAGFAASTGFFSSVGIDIAGLELNDGSGLSHQNRASARQIDELLRGMQRDPAGLAWERSFAIAGVRGTIANRMTGGETAGRFFGKTGTLNGVIALSGFLEHAYDGQRYHIAMLMNQVPNQAQARAAHDDVVELMARDLRELGQRPEAPVLTSVTSADNGQSVVVRWSPVDDATGYHVWRSPDGNRWDRDEARLISPDRTEHLTIPVEGDVGFIAVSALGAAGESARSDVYASRIGGDARALVVDGNDRWQAEPAFENTTGVGHDFAALLGAALDARSFDTCDNDALLAGDCDLGAYDMVFWSLGEEAFADESFSGMEQELVLEFVDGGGDLFVSGSEIAWDLYDQGSAADRAFFSDVLRATYVGDDAATFVARAAKPALTASDNDGLYGFFTPDRLVVSFPDVLAPLSGSEVWMTYAAGADAGQAAGLIYEGPTHRLVYLGFPVESVDTAADRAKIVRAAIAAFER